MIHGNEDQHVWTTQEGVGVRVCDMTDEHLRNCIFYLNKQYGALWDKHNNLVRVGHFVRAANATDTYLRGTPGDIWPIYDAMRREADRRRLRWFA